MRTRVAWGIFAIGLVAIGLEGCVPAPDRQDTEVLPASALQIKMTKAGRAEVSKIAAADTPVGENASVEKPSE